MYCIRNNRLLPKSSLNTGLEPISLDYDCQRPFRRLLPSTEKMTITFGGRPQAKKWKKYKKNWRRHLSPRSIISEDWLSHCLWYKDGRKLQAESKDGVWWPRNSSSSNYRIFICHLVHQQCMNSSYNCYTQWLIHSLLWYLKCIVPHCQVPWEGLDCCRQRVWIRGWFTCAHCTSTLQSY